MIKRILLPTDGSTSSERAASYAASLAMRFHSKIKVIHAYTPSPGALGKHVYSGPGVYKSLEEAQTLLNEVAAQLRSMGIDDIETDAVIGPAANVIIGVAESHSADLIVIGARGLSTWQGILLGSISMAVTQRAECPVLVVK